MALEDNFRDIAEKCSLPEGRHAVLLMDRGTMDVLAYVGKDQFDDVLEEFNWTVPQLRDQRYEAVVHLVTAAIGAERFYTCLLYTSPSPRDQRGSRMPSSA